MGGRVGETCHPTLFGGVMNASYDILHAIMSKPPVIEVKKSRARKTTSHENRIVMELIKKLSMEDLTKLLG